MIVLETKRLYLRPLTVEDKLDLMEILCDPNSMKYYPHPFSEQEVEKWIEWNIENYREYGHGLWAVVRKEGQLFLGDCGITMQNIGGQIVPEIGFHIKKEYCNQGYATEAALACKQYAFEVLGYPQVFSYTDVRNLASQRVVKKIGMRLFKRFEKNGRQQIAQMVSRT